jgi:ESS family glutamate:Na+ symporter
MRVRSFLEPSAALRWGATATAIANMQALTRRHGSSPQAFVIVPIVGAFFIDLINLAVLTFYLWPGFIIGR